MARDVHASSESSRRVWTVLALIALLLVTAWPAAQTATAAAPAPATSGLRTLNVPTHVAAPTAESRPAGATNVTLGKLYASTQLAPSSASNTPCQVSNFTIIIQKNCYPQTQNPSLVTLANGHFGVGYSIYTTLGPLCNATGNLSNLTSWTTTNVAWASSLTNASAWGAGVLLGSPSCRWPSASEPTFAAGSGSSVFGTYVLSNQTVNSTGPVGAQPYFPPDWNAPGGDALAFVQSIDNGTTWSSPSVIPGVTAAVRPQMAVYGDTIYVVYVYTATCCVTYPGGSGMGSFDPLAVDLVVSTNSGANWSAPITLPGLNASMGNWSSSPSLALNGVGALSVAYATNRSCLAVCYLPLLSYSTYGEQIVVATSLNNGSSWTGPVLSGNWTGESYTYAYYSDSYSGVYAYPWMSTPQTSIAYGPSGHSIYVAYSGTIYKSPGYSYLNWIYTGVLAAYSANNGATWTDSTVQADYSVSNADNYFSPAIAVSGTSAYVAYVWFNQSYCFSSSCDAFDGSVSSWVANSTNGVNWSTSFAGISSFQNAGYLMADYLGWDSSVTLSAGGRPVTATTLPGRASYSFVAGTPYVYTVDYWTNVSIAYVFTGPTTNVAFVAHDLHAGQPWGIAVNGVSYSTNQTTIRVTNMPLRVAVAFSVLAETVGTYRTLYTSSLSVASPHEFRGPAQVDVNFTVEYGLQLWLEPGFQAGTSMVYAFIGSTFYFIETVGAYTYNGPSFPWYFPANVTETFLSVADPPFTYWNGTGVGNVTGGTSYLNFTLGGPVNDTGWAGSYGVYTEQFSAAGLPVSSNYSFRFAGGNYSSPAPNVTYVPNIPTGGYSVSHITATSSLAGSEYFGWVAGGSNSVVVPAKPRVDFNFSLVNVAAPIGTVTFHAVGFGTGTVWSVEFNGTEYSASTPWLNLSTRPGTFPWAAGPAVSSNGSAGYLPSGPGGSLAVTNGLTVNLSYTASYRVDVVAGLGGSVVGSGSHWLLPGANATFSAVAGSGYSFGGWTGTGAGSYTGSARNASVVVGGAISETASFYPLPAARFNVTFVETGIPLGDWWTVDLNGVGYSSNSSSLVVSNLLSCAAGITGQYHEAVAVAYDTSGGATRYVATNAPAQFCTLGGLLQPLTFAPQYRVTVASSSGGSAFVSDSGVVSNASTWAYPSDPVQLEAGRDVGYVFGGWNGTGPGSYTGSDPLPTLAVAGPVSEVATFVPVATAPHPRFTVEFSSSPTLPAGTTWSVEINGTTYGGIGPDINVIGLAPATYTVTVSVALSGDGKSQWSPSPSTSSVTVAQNKTQPVEFGRPAYWVTISGTTGGTESPSSGWVASGTTLILSASPDVGQTFVGWSGSGAGNYSGNQSTPTATIAGPVTEFATFEPTAPAAVTVTSLWSSGSTWILLAAVGLVVGLAVGFLLRRLRTSERSSPSSDGDLARRFGREPGFGRWRAGGDLP